MSAGILRRAVAYLGWLVGAALAVLNFYLLGLLAATAAGRQRDRTPPSPELPHLVVLVPAHDEERVISATVATLFAQDYPVDRFEVVVVADNCSDLTGARAAAGGATVWRRNALDARGKGRALAWALDRLATRPRPPAGVVIVDADCAASPNLLSAIGSGLAGGADAVQTRYAVGNPDESSASALRFAAFSLVHDVRMAGKARLGLSSGLMGTGMGFSWEVLQRVPWSSFSITEDTEYHLQLVAAGVRVLYAPEAGVTSPMPTSMAASADQQARWEGGKAQIVAERVPRIIWDGVRRRDVVMVHAALEVLVPPQSLLLAANALGAGLSVAGGSALRRVATMNVLGQVGFVVGGLASVRAPAKTYRALFLVPALVLRKAAILARIASGRGPSTFVRTAREAESP